MDLWTRIFIKVLFFWDTPYIGSPSSHCSSHLWSPQTPEILLDVRPLRTRHPRRWSSWHHWGCRWSCLARSGTSCRTWRSRWRTVRQVEAVYGHVGRAGGCQEGAWGRRCLPRQLLLLSEGRFCTEGDIFQGQGFSGLRGQGWQELGRERHGWLPQGRTGSVKMTKWGSKFSLFQPYLMVVLNCQYLHLWIIRSI